MSMSMSKNQNAILKFNVKSQFQKSKLILMSFRKK